jgi:hypothetical protein
MANLGAIGVAGSFNAGDTLAAGGTSDIGYALGIVTAGGFAPMLTDVAIAAGAAWPVASPIAGTLSGAVSAFGSAAGAVVQPSAIVAVVKN